MVSISLFSFVNPISLIDKSHLIFQSCFLVFFHYYFLLNNSPEVADIVVERFLRILRRISGGNSQVSFNTLHFNYVPVPPTSHPIPNSSIMIWFLLKTSSQLALPLFAVYLLYIQQTKVIILYRTFLFWLSSLSIILSRAIYIAANCMILPLLIVE